jgi:putative transposase
VSRATSPSVGRCYGLARGCRVLEIPRSTVYATRARALASRPPRKRGPKIGWTDAELTEQIRGVLARSPFVG